MKKLLKVSVGACIAIVIGIVAFVVRKAVMVQNVFDEIYYAEHENRHFNLTKTQFENVKQYIVRIGYVRPDLWGEFSSYYYKDEYIDKNEFVSVTVYYDEPMVQVDFSVYANEEDDDNQEYIALIFWYNVTKKTLSYSELFVSTELTENSTKKDTNTDPEYIEAFMQKYSITREDITRMQQELFDRIVTDWCAGNAGLTRFSLENPGKFTIEDNTWARFDG